MRIFTKDPGVGWKRIGDSGGTGGKVLNSDPNPGGGRMKEPGGQKISDPGGSAAC